MKSIKRGLWRGLSAIMASLLVICLVAGSVANAYKAFINTRLGTTDRVAVQTGESDVDSTYFKSAFTSLADMMAAQERVATQIGSEGAVLLKNDNAALPLNKGSEKVTLWGLNSELPVFGGNIGSSVTAAEGQTRYGIKEAMAEEGFQLNQTMIDFYGKSEFDPYRMQSLFFGNPVMGHALTAVFWPTYEETLEYFVGELPASKYTDDVLASADGTVAVCMISRDSSEAADYNPEMKNTSEGDSFPTTVLGLSAHEKDMIELAKAHSTKVIVLINANNPMEVGELKNDPEIDSIMWVGEPGMYGFLGVAKCLSGEVNPSGHLPDTMATSSVSAPSMVNYGVYVYANASVTDAGVLTGDDKGDWYLVESEGIYVGYKYYETRYEDQILGAGNASSTEGSSTGSAWNYADEMAYPFGYGMSYTTFTQTLKDVDVKIGGTGTATVEVKNTGDVPGKCAVQLYVQAPYTTGGMEKSAIQLLDFAKTDIIEPGKTATVTVEFDPKYMASYDENVQKANGTMGAWVLDAGDYYFAVGNGAHEALNNVLALKTGSTDKLVPITSSEVISAEAAQKWTLDETDVETYSINVENALQDCDLNKLIPGAVEYTTRADWTKGWKPVEGITATEEMLVGLTNKSHTITANGDGVTWGADNGLQLVDFVLLDEEGKFAGVLPLDSPEWDKLVEQITIEDAINFIANAGDDLDPMDSIGFPRTYCNDGPLGFTYDQVGGYGIRWTDSEKNQPTYVGPDDPYAKYSMTTMPTEPMVAATFNKELVEEEGTLLGEQGLWANESSIFGPGLNLHRAPYCARAHEYYSEDSMLTNLMGTAVCKGGKSKGIMMEPKHFAFNHQELNRSGLSTFFTEQAGRELELRGFQGAMENNYAQGIMTAFNRAGTVFSGGHEGLQDQIGRKEWGYTGWYVTDMINGAEYMNWRDVVLGGGGGCLTSTAYAESVIGDMASESNKALILSDTAFQEKMQQALKYYCYTVANSNSMNGLDRNITFVTVRTWWQNALTGAQVAFGVLTIASLAMYALSFKKKSTKAV